MSCHGERHAVSIKDDQREQNTAQEYVQKGKSRNPGIADMKQSEEQWFRIKNVIPDETDLKWQLDFVEFVPFSVVNSSDLAEDWF